MARVTIEKMYQEEYWTNVYYLTGSIGDAAGPANDIVAAERAQTLSPVLFTKLRIDDNTPETDVYISTPLNVFGLNTITTEQMLPLFNVVRVDFGAGTGRPSRKYYRGMLVEQHINFNTIDAARVTDIQTTLVATLVALAAYVDVDGDPITSGTVYPKVGMRQLRRGSKKKIIPS